MTIDDRDISYDLNDLDQDTIFLIRKSLIATYSMGNFSSGDEEMLCMQLINSLGEFLPS